MMRLLSVMHMRITIVIDSGALISSSLLCTADIRIMTFWSGWAPIDPRVLFAKSSIVIGAAGIRSISRSMPHPSIAPSSSTVGLVILRLGIIAMSDAALWIPRSVMDSPSMVATSLGSSWNMSTSLPSLWYPFGILSVSESSSLDLGRIAMAMVEKSERLLNVFSDRSYTPRAYSVTMRCIVATRRPRTAGTSGMVFALNSPSTFFASSPSARLTAVTAAANVWLCCSTVFEGACAKTAAVALSGVAPSEPEAPFD